MIVDGGEIFLGQWVSHDLQLYIMTIIKLVFIAPFQNTVSKCFTIKQNTIKPTTITSSNKAIKQ